MTYIARRNARFAIAHILDPETKDTLCGLVAAGERLSNFKVVGRRDAKLCRSCAKSGRAEVVQNEDHRSLLPNPFDEPT